jgi:hypothetical protein
MKKNSSTTENIFENTTARAAHHKKIKQSFLNPSQLKFKAELETEQQKHSGKCSYHLTRTHPTESCNIKKECDKLLAAKKSSISPSNNTLTAPGQLHHITEEEFVDAVYTSNDVCSEEFSNDTNKEVLHYLTSVTNHYFCLVKSSLNLVSRHDMKYPIIVGSGANYHMFKDIEFFDSLQPVSGNVILGDGKTSLPIQGIGTIKLQIEDKVISVQDV